MAASKSFIEEIQDRMGDHFEVAYKACEWLDSKKTIEPHLTGTDVQNYLKDLAREQLGEDDPIQSDIDVKLHKIWDKMYSHTAMNA